MVAQTLCPSRNTKGSSHKVQAFFWHTRPSCTFSFTKAPCCLKLLIPASNAIGRGGITVKLSPECPLHRNSWFMFRKLQHTKRFLLQSRHYRFGTLLNEREGGEWDCTCAQNLNTCCSIPCGKLTNAGVFKTVMEDWNRSNHFDIPCTYIHIYVNWVKAHVGTYGNELANQLAKAAAQNGDTSIS